MKHKVFASVLYVRVEPHMAQFARKFGKEEFGSVSAYINYLLAKDANDTGSINKMIEIAEKRFEPKNQNKGKRRRQTVSATTE